MNAVCLQRRQDNSKKKRALSSSLDNLNIVCIASLWILIIIPKPWIAFITWFESRPYHNNGKLSNLLSPATTEPASQPFPESRSGPGDFGRTNETILP
jgi:hypothetical protein